MRDTHPQELFRRLTFGETYSRAFAVAQERWAFFLSIGVIIFVPYVCFMITYLNFLGAVVEASAEDAANGNQQGQGNNDSAVMDTLAHAHGEVSKVVAELLLYSFVGIMGGCAISHAVAQLYVGESPPMKDCIKLAFRRFCNIFCASWIVGVGIMVGYVLTILVAALLFAAQNTICALLAVAVIVAFVVACVYIQVAMMLATPVVMVENKGPIQTIQRCWELANNNRCYIYCTLFCLVFCIMFVVGIVMGIIFAQDPMARFSTGGAIIQTLPNIVILPLATIISTVVYLNIRVEHEGLNREGLLKDLGGDDWEDGMAVVEGEYTKVLSSEKV